MKRTLEIDVDGERVYLRKSFLGWHVVYPVKIDGKYNWKHIITGGSWINLGIVSLLVLFFYGATREYSTAVKMLNECLSANPLIIPF